MNTEYPKIETLLNRDEKTGRIIEGVWRLPEFEYLQALNWRWSEKLDGTNIRIEWQPKEDRSGPALAIKGRTDRAQMPVTLMEYLHALVNAEKMAEVFTDAPAVVYGEAYGGNIQSAGRYYKLDGSYGFSIFDIRIGEWWLKWENIQEIAMKLELPLVPNFGSGSLALAIQFVYEGFQSALGIIAAEGLVVRPAVDLRMRNGQRVIGKIKTTDFVGWKKHGKEKGDG